jgi:hypothetical protein
MTKIAIESEGWTPEEMSAVAGKLKVPKQLLPEAPSDRLTLSRLLSRIAHRKGFSVKQTGMKEKRLEAEIWAQGGDSDAMKLAGRVIQEEGVEDLTLDGDHFSLGELRDAFIAARGKVFTWVWTDHIRSLILDTWRGVAARHDGRIYWISDQYLDEVRMLGRLVEELGVCVLCIVVLGPEQTRFVEELLLDTVEAEILDIKDKIDNFSGSERMSRYNGTLKDIERGKQRIRWFIEYGAAEVLIPHEEKLNARLDVLERRVREEFIDPALAAVKKEPASAPRRRKRHIDLPKTAPPPPEPVTPPAKIAPLPDPYVSLDGIPFVRQTDLDSEGLLGFAADGDASAAVAKLAAAGFADRWILVEGAGHFFLPSTGMLRIYLSSISKAMAKGLMTYGITLNL